MSDFTNPGGFLDPFDGFDKPDISQGDPNAAAEYSGGGYTWVVFPHG